MHDVDLYLDASRYYEERGTTGRLLPFPLLASTDHVNGGQTPSLQPSLFVLRIRMPNLDFRQRRIIFRKEPWTEDLLDHFPGP
jgi:hypothetical protein